MICKVCTSLLPLLILALPDGRYNPTICWHVFCLDVHILSVTAFVDATDPSTLVNFNKQLARIQRRCMISCILNQKSKAQELIENANMRFNTISPPSLFVQLNINKKRNNYIVGGSFVCYLVLENLHLKGYPLYFIHVAFYSSVSCVSDLIESQQYCNPCESVISIFT